MEIEYLSKSWIKKGEQIELRQKNTISFAPTGTWTAVFRTLRTCPWRGRRQPLDKRFQLFEVIIPPFEPPKIFLIILKLSPNYPKIIDNFLNMIFSFDIKREKYILKIIENFGKIWR